jgi:hypothetical protein
MLTQLLSHDALFSHSICSSIYSYALILLFSFFSTYIAAFVNAEGLHYYLLLLLFKDYGMWFYGVMMSKLIQYQAADSTGRPAILFCCTGKLQHMEAYE